MLERAECTPPSAPVSHYNHAKFIVVELVTVDIIWVIMVRPQSSSAPEHEPSPKMRIIDRKGQTSNCTRWHDRGLDLRISRRKDNSTGRLWDYESDKTMIG
jgi:hypothetical protein